MIRDIFILHHTHVDFGYTDSREKVFDDLVNMIDPVDDLIAKRRRRPQSERFRWIHEVSWCVLEYIRRNGLRKAKRMIENIRRGDAELTALYVNPTDLFDEEMFRWSIDQAVELARREKLPLETAMFCDCPGIAWSVVDLLAERGVKYLSAAPNYVMAYPLEVERPFYWQGPKGGRVLVWFTDWRKGWYGEGYALGFSEDPNQAAENLMTYAAQLETEGYRWDALAVHYASDNRPADPKLMDVVAAFNAAQSVRTATMATNRDFFSYMVRRHGKEFRVHEGAWPDWWSNGSGSAAYETSCSRRAKAAMRRGTALLRLKKKTDASCLREEALQAMTMFDEHTWGHNTSSRYPWGLPARLGWAKKRAYALEALELAKRYEQQAIENIAKPGRVVLTNPFDHEIKAFVSLPSQNKGKKASDLQADREEIIPGQRIDTSVNGYLVTLPKQTIREYELVPSTSNVKTACVMRNEHFRFSVNRKTGAITQLYDGMGKSLLNGRPYGFAELIHEKVAHGGRKQIYDNTLGMENPKSKCSRPVFIRKTGHERPRRAEITDGPVFASLRTHGKLPGVRFEREVRLFHATPRIDVLLRLNKAVDVNYESLYLAFPFHMKQPRIWIENAGVVYRAGVDQLPGSATDWQSLGEYIAVSDGKNTAILVPHDCPLVQVGDINTGKWARKLDVRDGRLFSWVMNNMWYTNFPVYQEGTVELAWSLTIQPGRFNPASAEEFSRSCRIGLCIHQPEMTE